MIHDDLREQIQRAIDAHGANAVARALHVSRGGLTSFLAGRGAHATEVVIRVMAPALARIDEKASQR